jgi:hypothetical protein
VAVERAPVALGQLAIASRHDPGLCRPTTHDRHLLPTCAL